MIPFDHFGGVMVTLELLRSPLSPRRPSTWFWIGHALNCLATSLVAACESAVLKGREAGV